MKTQRPTQQQQQQQQQRKTHNTANLTEVEMIERTNTQVYLRTGNAQFYLFKTYERYLASSKRGEKKSSTQVFLNSVLVELVSKNFIRRSTAVSLLVGVLSPVNH